MGHPLSWCTQQNKKVGHPPTIVHELAHSLFDAADYDYSAGALALSPLLQFDNADNYSMFAEFSYRIAQYYP
jgi:hypothetical protein